MKTAKRKENFLKTDTYQQLDQAHRDIKTAVDAGSFLGGLNILLLLMLLFNPVYAAKTNWLGIGSIAIGIPIIFGCTLGIRRRDSIAAKAITAYFTISTILYIYLCWQGLMPSTLIMLTFIPFFPYLLYGLYRGICGNSILNQENLNRSIEPSINLDLENSVENFAEIKFRQQFDRAHKNIETGVRSGLLMGGITFCINVALFSMLKSIGSLAMLLFVIFPLDVLVIFGSTLEIYQKKSSSAISILGYSLFSLIVKASELDRGGVTFLFALLLSTYCFYGLYKGIVGISDLERLTELRADFDRSIEDSIQNRSDTDSDDLAPTESASISTISIVESREIMLEVERRDETRRARSTHRRLLALASQRDRMGLNSERACGSTLGTWRVVHLEFQRLARRQLLRVIEGLLDGAVPFRPAAPALHLHGGCSSRMKSMRSVALSLVWHS